jgi:hypothetical protein
MKMQSKPIVALASGALLAFSVLSQTAQAQSIIIPSKTVTLANSDNIPADDLNITYEVTQDIVGDSFYNYSYIIGNPSPATVNDFEVLFNTGVAGSEFNATGGFFSTPDGDTGLEWGFQLAAGDNSPGITLKFQSDDPPVYSTANASGTPNPPASWQTAPGGNPVPVPNAAVPEPATNALIAAGLLLLAFQPNIFKRA